MAAPKDAGPVRCVETQRHVEPLDSDRGPGNEIPQGPPTTKGASPYRARTSSSCVKMWWCSARSVENSGSQDPAMTLTATSLIFTNNQAIGGAGGAGSNGGNGLGGGIENHNGATLTLSGSMLTGNQAVGGAGEAGGNGFGGGLFNDGLSTAPGNAGTPTALTVTGSTITANQATGGAAGASGSAGLGVGGGIYLTD